MSIISSCKNICRCPLDEIAERWYIWAHISTFCRISVTFVDKDGEEKHIQVPIGMSMLEAAHENDIDLEGN